MNLSVLEKKLKAHATKERAKTNAWFFKTGKGEYGEGDKFLGVTVPQVRMVVKECVRDGANLTLAQEALLSPLHEVRLAGAMLFTTLYDKAVKEKKAAEINEIVKVYLLHGKKLNNWDLVDASAPKVLGRYLLTIKKSEAKEILQKLIVSSSLWENRIAVVSMQALIKEGETVLPLFVIKTQLHHRHDLMHKANGWMLREIGKYSEKEVLHHFLDQYGGVMPRTTLRYALERESETIRRKYMEMKSKKK